MKQKQSSVIAAHSFVGKRKVVTCEWNFTSQLYDQLFSCKLEIMFFAYFACYVFSVDIWHLSFVELKNFFRGHGTGGVARNFFEGGFATFRRFFFILVRIWRIQ